MTRDANSLIESVYMWIMAKISRIIVFQRRYDRESPLCFSVVAHGRLRCCLSCTMLRTVGRKVATCLHCFLIAMFTCFCSILKLPEQLVSRTAVLLILRTVGCRAISKVGRGVPEQERWCHIAPVKKRPAGYKAKNVVKRRNHRMFHHKVIMERALVSRCSVTTRAIQPRPKVVDPVRAYFFLSSDTV
ncbi:hypothetical protein BDW75DRAFT_80461 [Aspergillus navahoensis]